MRNPERGFSLIEMILVAALVAVLGGAVYGALSQGIRLWRYVMEARPFIDTDQMVDRLTLDLRNAFMDSNNPFQGDGRQIRFFTLASGSRDEATRKMFGPFVRPVFVVYQYDEENKQIVKIQQEYTGLLSERKKSPPVKTVVMDHVEDALFSFYRGRDQQGGQVWRKIWKEKEPCMPRGVRMTVQLDEVMSMRRTDQVISLLGSFCKEG